MAGEKNGNRSQVIGGDPVVNPDELAHALLEWAGVLRRVGGALMVGAVREEVQGVAGPEHATTHVVIEWQRWGQTVRPEPEPTPDEEPVLDGVQTD